MNVYVAASWRTERQPAVVAAIRAAGHTVYDFRNPPNGSGFGWEQVGKQSDPRGLSPGEFLDMLAHPRAIAGFRSDIDALRAADACVLVQPSGRSAALELGYAAGMGKRCAVLLEYYQEPELMLKVASLLTPSLIDILEWLEPND